MEPVLRSFIFCDAVVPGLDGKLTCYGTFSDLYSSKFPITYPQFCILTTWTRGVGFHIQQIKILNPTKTMVLCQSPQMYFTLNDETETANVKTDVNQIVFAEPGTYYFQVYLDNELLGEFPLHFRLRS